MEIGGGAGDGSATAATAEVGDVAEDDASLFENEEERAENDDAQKKGTERQKGDHEIGAQIGGRRFRVGATSASGSIDGRVQDLDRVDGASSSKHRVVFHHPVDAAEGRFHAADAADAADADTRLLRVTKVIPNFVVVFDVVVDNVDVVVVHVINAVTVDVVVVIFVSIPERLNVDFFRRHFPFREIIIQVSCVSSSSSSRSSGNVVVAVVFVFVDVFVLSEGRF